VEGNIYACLVMGLDFLYNFGWLIIIKVDRTIWRPRSEFFPIKAEIALDWKPRDHMTLKSLIFVESVRWGSSKDCNIISIWLSNKSWIKWMEPHARTCISFSINLIQEYNKLNSLSHNKVYTYKRSKWYLNINCILQNAYKRKEQELVSIIEISACSACGLSFITDLMSRKVIGRQLKSYLLSYLWSIISGNHASSLH